MSATKPVSNWWYLLPILLGIIGAVVAWFRIRKADPRKARNMIIVGLGLTLIGGGSGDYLLDPWFDELEQIDLWCAEQFDLAIADPVKYQDSTVMLKNGCFTHFEAWKHSSVSYNDGTAEKILNEKGTSISEVVQLNVQREQGLD
jgi:hypothetical protein